MQSERYMVSIPCNLTWACCLKGKCVISHTGDHAVYNVVGKVCQSCPHGLHAV